MFVGLVLCGADDEGARGGVDDISGDGAEVVDFHDAFDLREKSADEAEISCCQARDGGDGLGVGEVVGVEVEPEGAPMSGQDEGEFGVGQWPVVVSESDAAVELGVAGEAFFDAGHADEDQAVGVAVVFVAQHFQGAGGQPFGFVDDEQFGVVVTGGVDDRCRRGGEVLVDAGVDAAAGFVDVVADSAWSGP